MAIEDISEMGKRKRIISLILLQVSLAIGIFAGFLCFCLIWQANPVDRKDDQVWLRLFWRAIPLVYWMVPCLLLPYLVAFWRKGMHWGLSWVLGFLGGVFFAPSLGIIYVFAGFFSDRGQILHVFIPVSAFFALIMAGMMAHLSRYVSDLASGEFRGGWFKKLLMLIMLGVAGWTIVFPILYNDGVVNHFKRWRSQRNRILRDEHIAKLDAAHVTGYFPREWLENSTLTVRCAVSMGPTSEYRWSKRGEQFCRYFLKPDFYGKRWSKPFDVNEESRQALMDALNIAVRDRLWEHANVKPETPVLDGGVKTFEFQLGPHKGHFNWYTGGDAPELELFNHKVKIWLRGMREHRERSSPDLLTKESRQRIAKEDDIRIVIYEELIRKYGATVPLGQSGPQMIYLGTQESGFYRKWVDPSQKVMRSFMAWQVKPYSQCKIEESEIKDVKLSGAKGRLIWIGPIRWFSEEAAELSTGAWDNINAKNAPCECKRERVIFENGKWRIVQSPDKWRKKLKSDRERK